MSDAEPLFDKIRVLHWPELPKTDQEITPHHQPTGDTMNAIATPATTIQTLTPFILGQFIPEQGGYYAGIVRGEADAPAHHLFVAPENASADDLAWGRYGKSIEGASFVNDGLANTKALIAAGKCPAAEACHAYRGNGFDDWYLPAQAEIKVCFANAREHFDKEWHWSSTQYSAGYAWVQTFVGGDQDFYTKANVYRVRAVRRLIIQ